MFQLCPIIKRVVYSRKLVTWSTAATARRTMLSRCTLDSNASGEKLYHNNNSYDEAIAALNTLQSNAATLEKVHARGINASIEAFQQQLEHMKVLGIPPESLERLRAIHVAGTKGKGSTCAYTESILRAHGYKTGFYSSPHLVMVRERIRINGQPISKDVFASAFWSMYNMLKKRERAEGVQIPAYFRFLTLLAFKIFLEENVDVAVIEVGIGGEYDCTNVLRQPYVTGITSLGLDHTRLLGNTLEQIAWQKSGIFKPNAPAIIAPHQPESVLSVLRDRAKERQCSIHIAPPFHAYDWLVPKLPLGISGDAQLDNASLALQLVNTWIQRHKNNNVANECYRFNESKHISNIPIARSLPIDDTMAQALNQCKWPGRCQRIEKPGITFYLDGAHTLESMIQCVRWFRRETTHFERAKCSPRRALLFHCTGDREPQTLLNEISEIDFDQAYFCPNRIHRRLEMFSDSSNLTVDPSKELEKCNRDRYIWSHLVTSSRLHVAAGVNGGAVEDDIVIEEGNGVVYPCITDAVHKILSTADPSNPLHVLVTGSLHLVGGVLSILDPSLK